MIKNYIGHSNIAWQFQGGRAELHAGRAEYYYQPAGFAGRVFLSRALGPQQARTIPDSTEFIINDCKIFTRY